jgi:hypothetical protein
MGGAARIEVFTLRQITPADADAYVAHRLPQYRDPHRRGGGARHGSSGLCSARAATGTRAGLAIPVRGDYGTGKTHLLLFAQARLCNAWPGDAAEVTVLSAPGTEAPFPMWYLTVVAPLLDRLGLPRLFAKLLAAAACEVADQVPLTAKLAGNIRKDPLDVYPLLREGLLSRTDVERALLHAVATMLLMAISRNQPVRTT